MATVVKMRGQKALERHMKTMSNPSKVFDKDIKKSALHSARQLTITTPKKTGNTARNWSVPKKIGLSFYRVSNAVRTSDGKHLLAQILDQGRGEVLPVKSNKLYIPLSNKGRSKPLGGKIPKDLVFGTDYVLARRSKAFAGTKYKEKENIKASRRITRAMIKTIRRVHGGR